MLPSKVSDDTLSKIAHEVNARSQKAGRLHQQAEDHLTTSAKLLADAKKHCEAVGIDFKQWITQHLDLSYGWVNTLLKIGASGDKSTMHGLLEDLRSNTAQRARKAREKKKIELTKLKQIAASRPHEEVEDDEAEESEDEIIKRAVETVPLILQASAPNSIIVVHRTMQRVVDRVYEALKEVTLDQAFNVLVQVHDRLDAMDEKAR